MGILHNCENVIVKKFPALFTTCSYDEHWKPASMYCSVCATLDYTNILHFENIQSEERFFVETLNASNVVQPRYKISFTLEQYLLYIIILYGSNVINTFSYSIDGRTRIPKKRHQKRKYLEVTLIC